MFMLKAFPIELNSHVQKARHKSTTKGSFNYCAFLDLLVQDCKKELLKRRVTLAFIA